MSRENNANKYLPNGCEIILVTGVPAVGKSYMIEEYISTHENCVFVKEEIESW
jgi:predicted AAA+ superfamily ATPase